MDNFQHAEITLALLNRIFSRGYEKVIIDCGGSDVYASPAQSLTESIMDNQDPLGRIPLWGLAFMETTFVVDKKAGTPRGDFVKVGLLVYIEGVYVKGVPPEWTTDEFKARRVQNKMRGIYDSVPIYCSHGNFLPHEHQPSLLQVVASCSKGCFKDWNFVERRTPEPEQHIDDY